MPNHTLNDAEIADIRHQLQELQVEHRDLDAAIQALLKEESSVTALVAERERIEREIRDAKEARDMATPKRTVDLMLTDIDLDFFR